MEDDKWSFGLSTSTTRSCQSPVKFQSDLSFDFEDIEEEHDELNIEYPCPVCGEEYDLVGLCWHIDEEHPTLRSEVCPVCLSWVEHNLVGHIAMHENHIKSEHKLKFHKEDSYSSFSSPRKNLEDGYLQSLLLGSTTLVSSSKMVPDPLLSFIRNIPVADESTTSTLKSPTEANLEEKVAGEKTMEKDINISPLSNEDQQEKLRRCEFVQGLFLSTLLDDDL